MEKRDSMVEEEEKKVPGIYSCNSIPNSKIIHGERWRERVQEGSITAVQLYLS